MVDTLYSSTTPETAPRYDYYTVDIVTNEVLAQIPFEDVSYERRLKDYGSFEGKITVTAQTSDLDLYNSTLPGKTALYVVRNGVCVWGGIIWGRSYDLQGRSLSVSGAEFTSYLAHRIIWKTYSFKFPTQLTKILKSDMVKVSITDRVLKKPLPVTDGQGNTTKVYVSFSESDLVQYSGYYLVQSSPAPTQTVFYVNIPNLPGRAGTYDNVTVSAKVDTYDYIKDLLKDVFVDFKDTEFANEIIAPGIKLPSLIYSYECTNNTTKIVTKETHGMVVGQAVEIKNIPSYLCGDQLVSEVPTATSFTYTIPVLEITHVQRTSNVATVYFNTAETASTQINPFVSGMTVNVDASSNTFDGAAVTITATTENSISYPNTGTAVAKTVATGQVTVPNLALTVASTTQINVYSREIQATGPKTMRYVMRDLGSVTVWTSRSHGFTKGDKVIINSEQYSDLNNNGLPVLITYVDSSKNKFKYYQSDFSASSKNIKAAVGGEVDLDNTKTRTAELATPVKKLRLNTATTFSYEVGDLVRVRGVDGIYWGRSIYNGYHKITDLDVSNDVDATESLQITHIQAMSNTTARIFTNREHGIRLDDKIKVQNFVAPYETFNGEYTVSDVYDPDAAASGVAWVEYLFTPRNVTVTPSTKTSTSGFTAIPKVSVFGAAWFQYDMPEHGTVREPNDTIPINSIAYKTFKKAVTAYCEREHYLSVGDSISVKISEKEIYSGSYTVASIVSPTAFTYKLGSGAPRTTVSKTAVTGSFTRVKTVVGSIPVQEIPIDRVSRKANVATIYSTDHNLTVGDRINIEIADASFATFENGGEPVDITTADVNQFQYKNVGSDYGTVAIANATVVNRTATLYTTTTHGFGADASVTITGVSAVYNGTYTIATIGANFFTYTVSTRTAATTTPPVGGVWRASSGLVVTNSFAYTSYRGLENVQDIDSIASASNLVTITAPDHGFSNGDLVNIYVPDKIYKNFNYGNTPVTISNATTNTFTYLSSTNSPITNKPYPTGNVATTLVTGFCTFAASAAKVPVAIARSYGEFPYNAGISGLDYTPSTYSNTQFASDEIRGSDMITVIEHLERYTNRTDGFDYRIDCSLAEGVDSRKVFKRSFTIVPRTPETLIDYLENMPNGRLERGTYAPASAFGADKIVFEYPGNVENVNLSEQADGSAATRMFVVGNNSDLGGGASARYSAASDTYLLNAGWPILDRVEKVEWPLIGINQINVDEWGNYDSEADMHKTATRFLNESRPPVGDFTITVNGSLSPEVGTFDPGNWCSLIVNDAFVRERMNSILEPRKDVIVRKIDGIRVNVPNNPAFPEMIDLDLVTEWQVDTIGK